MTLNRAFLVGYLPLALNYITVWMLGDSSKMGHLPFDVAMLCLVAQFPGLGIPFAWKTLRLFGLAFGCLAHSVPLLFWAATNLELTALPGGNGGVLIVAAALSFLGMLICFAIAVPVSILPALRANRAASKSGLLAATNPVELSGDMPLIKERFSDLQKVLKVEGDKIQTSLESALGEVEKQNAQLEALRTEEQRLHSELETYRNLAEIGEGQAKALQVMLRKGKYVDYGIGFFLGLLSSAAVAASSHFLGGVVGGP